MRLELEMSPQRYSIIVNGVERIGSFNDVCNLIAGLKSGQDVTVKRER